MLEKTTQNASRSRKFSHFIDSVIQVEKKNGSIFVRTILPNKERKKDGINIHIFEPSISNIFTYLECLYDRYF